MTSQLVVDARMMAVWRRGKPASLLHHSDQGSQYTSAYFQGLLQEQGITCSMSRAGEIWDNSAMESFFSSLKTERTARKVYRTRDQARADVFDYIERFYNPRRRHSSSATSVRYSSRRFKKLRFVSTEPAAGQRWLSNSTIKTVKVNDQRQPASRHYSKFIGSRPLKSQYPVPIISTRQG